MVNPEGSCTSLFCCFQNFVAVFNKTIIPLVLVGYELIIANSGYAPRWLFIFSYRTRAHGMIVKYVINSCKMLMIDFRKFIFRENVFFTGNIFTVNFHFNGGVAVKLMVKCNVQKR